MIESPDHARKAARCWLAAVLMAATALLAAMPATAAQVGNAPVAADRNANSDASVSVAEQALPLRSRAALETWLQQHDRTPLDRMPAGARIRFLASLTFGDNGLTGFDSTELGTTLAPADIRAVLALFGPEAEAYAAHIESTAPHGGGAPVTTLSDIERRFNRLYLLDNELHALDDSARGKALADRYRQLFPQARDAEALRAANDPDLKLLYRAATIANSYAPDPAAAEAMAMTLAAMDARGIAAAADVSRTRQALLAAHRFDAARQFTQAHASAQLSPLPRLRGAETDFGGQPTLWQLDAAADTLTRVPVDLDPLQIMVLAGCHFSVDAARDIAVDPLLAPLFQQHARWLALPPGQEDLDAVREWNREHPQASMQMLYDRAEWPMFPRWTMPTFYVIRHGEVIGSMSGWSASSRSELVALLRRTGVLQ